MISVITNVVQNKFFIFHLIRMLCTIMVKIYDTKIFPLIILIIKGKKAKIYSLLTFIFMFSLSILPHELAIKNVNQAALTSYEIILILCFSLFTYFQIYNKNISKTHLIFLSYGALLY